MNQMTTMSRKERNQRITHNAMGISLGVGLVGGIAYGLLDTGNLMPFDADISFLIIGMGLTYMIATFAGDRYYR